MQIATLVSVLDHPHQAADHLHAWGLADVDRARQSLADLAECGLTLDLLASLCDLLAAQLPQVSDPDAALDGVRRMLLASRSPLSLAALFERDPPALAMLLKVLDLGPRWRQLVIADPEAFDLLRMTDAQPLSRAAILGEICAEAGSLQDERSVCEALGRMRRRHLLRIAYGEVHLGHNFELVTQQLTYLTEALVAAALNTASSNSQDDRPALRRAPARDEQVCLLAMGRLGAAEMDYGDELDMLFVYDAPAEEAARHSAHDRLERQARLVGRLLSSVHDGPGFFVHFMPLPDTASPLAAHTADDVLLGLDSFGRTWHRQAMLRARPIAGDLPLGADVLGRLQPWIFRRYLSRADETGIQALRRRILRQAESSGGSGLEHCRGGLADLEAGIEFLQLLFGGDHAEVRRLGVLDAIAGLEQAGILSPSERTLLAECYVWLRERQHRAQIGDREHVGDSTADDPERTRRVWETISRFLDTSSADETPPIVDLLLDPAPAAPEVAATLAPFGFAQPNEALAQLQDLATERVPFLSTRRCRHFLSLIVVRLLEQIAATPDPDGTLSNLARVSDSLGAKGVLWELLHFHPASLHLYMRLCAASPYLSDILTTNPGMIDDLVDSLQLDKLPTLAELEAQLGELARGGVDPLPILHDLKNASHLRIGVRDILGQESIDATHAALADVAEFCLDHVARREFVRLVEKFGPPTIGPGPYEGEPCRSVILALGKLGGREPNYHSSVEVAFLYEAEGTTRPATKSRRDQRTANNHFFTQLAQRVLKEVAQLTPQGRLYSVDLLLRPIGVGGAMALTFGDFAQHFTSRAAPLWQWQALCQARPIFGAPAARDALQQMVRELIAARSPQDGDQAAICQARLAAQRGASELNLKRGPGGTLDIESLVQHLQLRHAAQSPEILQPGTLTVLSALADCGYLPRDHAEYFAESYRLLRRIESALRLMNTSARHDLPEDLSELRKLALLLNHPHAESLRDRVIITLAENRRRFERLMNP